jgi:hypothetical protein
LPWPGLESLLPISAIIAILGIMDRTIVSETAVLNGMVQAKGKAAKYANKPRDAMARFV